MLLNLDPLKNNRDYRLLFIGQFISFLGSMISYVAIPYQVFQLTHDNWLVGMLGLVQLGPVLIFGILGGTFADRLNRRTLLLTSETLMCLLIVGLLINAFQDQPSVKAIFVLVACFQSVMGFHRPAMDAMTQKLVSKKDYAAVGALGSFRYSTGAIAGPAIGGILIASFGVKGAYLFDVCSFLIALVALSMITKMPNPEPSTQSPFMDAKEGFRYAISKPELMGTYLIDIVAMVFAFPVALFPAMSEQWGNASAAGMLFSSMAVGALFATLISGWTGKVKHHGRGVVIAAALWAIFIIALGQTTQLWQALLCLALAGGADMISGLYRGIIWNETVPNQLRGRLSGIEMISYMSGPLLGNARAGWVAAHSSVATSITTGGVICTVAVIGTAFLLPKFWKYESQVGKDLF